MLRLTSLGRLYVRTLVLLDGREAPVVLKREPHHSADVSRLDEREGRAVLGYQLQRGSRHGDAPFRLDGREGLAVLGDVLEHELHRGADVSHEREDLVVLERQVQRASRQDGDPLEPQSQPGDDEGEGFLLDDLGNASGSNLMKPAKLAKTHSILLYGRM